MLLLLLRPPEEAGLPPAVAPTITSVTAGDGLLTVAFTSVTDATLYEVEATVVEVATTGTRVLTFSLAVGNRVTTSTGTGVRVTTSTATANRVTTSTGTGIRKTLSVEG